MGLPRRVSSYHHDSVAQDDPLVEVHFSEVFDSRLDDESEQGPWCVDLGDAIACMSTVQVWLALASGKVVPETKVWRDGMGCWLVIAQVPELTDEDDPAQLERQSVPEQSEIRRRRSLTKPEPVTIGSRWRRSLMSHWRRYLVLAAVVAGGLAGAIAFHVATKPPPVEPLRRVAVDVAERSRLLVDRARETTLQRERAWWLSRWASSSR